MKKLLSILIIVASFVFIVFIFTKQGIVAYADSSIFSDVKSGSWYYNDVVEAQKAGYVSGIGGGKYSPDTTITYAEYLAVLDRILDSSVDKIESTGKWYDKYITFAKQKGILDTTEVINPTKGIPRQDMFKYTCKALGISPDTTGKVIFGDVPAGTTAAGYCNAAYNEFLCEGAGTMSNGSLRFAWNETATRSQLASMALRTRDYKADPAGFKAKKSAARQENSTPSTPSVDPSKYTINPSTDIYKGSLVRSVARTFEDVVFDNIKISPDGTVTGNIPNVLPSGFKYRIVIGGMDPNDDLHYVYGTDNYDFKIINKKFDVPLSSLSSAAVKVEILNSSGSSSGYRSKDYKTGAINEVINTK